MDVEERRVMEILKKSQKRDFFTGSSLLYLSLFFLLIFFNPELRGQERKEEGEGEQKLSEVKEGEGSLTAFAGIDWGTEFKEVQEEFRDLVSSEDKKERTEILHIKRNAFILARQNDSLYHYSFYKTPYALARLENKDLDFEEYDEEKEGVFFHAKVSFPALETALIKEKLEKKYGKHQASSGSEEKGSGAYIWRLGGGFIFLWYESYSGKIFTRRIDYLSAEHAKKIAKEYKDYFIAKEKLILEEIKN